MKRYRDILLFLLLGATVNVAVAWVIALMPTTDESSSEISIGYFNAADEGWSLYRIESFGTHFYESNRWKVHIDEEELLRLKEFFRDYTMENVKPNWGSMDVTTNLYQTLPGPPEHAKENRMFEARGWPMRSLWCLRYIYVEDGAGIKMYGPRGLIEISILPYEGGWPRVVPLYPIWRGLLFNTLFYAAILWLFFPGPFVLRRFIRRKRGLCPQCAYDLRGARHYACPECGTNIMKSQQS